MGNPFFNAMGGPQGQQGGRKNLAPDLIQYLQNFQGNPVQMLQAKINESGINQEQYNQLHSVAERIAQKMMGISPRR